MYPLQAPAPGGLELILILLIFVLLLVIPIGLAYWVYKDATSRGDDNAVVWAVAVGVLTAVTLIGGIAALVVYVLQRD
jgi:hypothetical protein